MARELNLPELPLRGTQLIEASAGTGKTFTMTTLVLRLLVERGLELRSILVMTFTRAATQELIHRIGGRIEEALAGFEEKSPPADPLLSELVQRWERNPKREVALQRLRRAQHELEQAAVYTIHGWCQRVLSEFALECGTAEEIEIESDTQDRLEGLAQDYWSRRLYGAPEAWVQAVYHDPACRPQQLAGLASKGALAPVLRIGPELDFARSLEEERAEGSELRERAAQIQRTWDTIESFYREIYPLLNHVKYRKASYLPQLLELQRICQKIQCQRLLPSELETFGNWSDYFQESSLRAGLKKNKSLPPNPCAGRFSGISSITSAMLSRYRAWSQSFRQDFLENLQKQAQDTARGGNRKSHDEVLRELHRLLRLDNGAELQSQLCQRYPVCLVDEFQDTDPVQYEIFQRVWGQDRGVLFLVGDPKQAIYSFRGADIAAYKRARDNLSGEPFSLSHNFRSHPELIAAVNTLFSRHKRPFLDTSIGFEPVDSGKSQLEWSYKGVKAPPFAIVASPEGQKKPDAAWIISAVVQRVQQLCSGFYRIGDRVVQAGDIAILSRSNSKADAILAALGEHGIAAAVQKKTLIWSTAEAQEFFYCLQAMAQPSNASAMRLALTTRALGLDLNDISELAQSDEQWDRWQQRFAGWRQRWIRQGFAAAFTQLNEDMKVQERLRRTAQGGRARTNWLHVGELMHQYWGQRGKSIRYGMEQLCLALEDPERFSDDEALVREGEERDLLQIWTMHRSKGLEFPVVLCPIFDSIRGLADDRSFLVHPPGEQTRHLVFKDQSPDELTARATAECFAEESRLLYVALTRAQYRCEVISPFGTKALNHPWDYLLYFEDDAVAGDFAAGYEAFDHFRQTNSKRTYDTYRSQLDAVAQTAPGSIEVIEGQRAPAVVPGEAVLGGMDPSPESQPSPKSWPASIELGPKSSSFSALAAGHHSENKDEVEDDDPRAESAAASLVSSLLEAPEEPSDPQNFQSLAPGANTGLFLHACLEQPELWSRRAGAHDAVLAEVMRRYDVDPELGAEIERGLATVLGSPLDDRPTPLRLADLSPAKRRVELEFDFRLGMWPGASLETAALSTPRVMDPEELARAMAGHGAPPPVVDYAKSRMARDFGELYGWMHGFIDLVFEHEGQVFVADYKSNDLGPSKADYGQEQMWRSMQEHDYILQATIYAVAVHRWLKLAKPQYDPASDFGGIYYFYLRGMDLQDKERPGVLFWKPSKEWLLAVDRCMDAKKEEA